MPLIQWGSPSISVSGNGFYFDQAGRTFLQQLNASGTAYHSLMYLDSNDEVVVGNNALLQRIPPLRARDIRLIPAAAADVIAPETGVKLFWDSATDTLSAKNAAGTVVRYSGVRRL